MKAVKLSLVIMAAALLTIGLSGMAYAFHSGGVAECEGCHTMHNSFEGKAMTVSGGPTGVYLLKGSDQSSTCIECHGETPLGSSYHMVTPAASMPIGTPPGDYTPGGDFGWLTKTYTWIPRGTVATDTVTSPGERKGHNIIAVDFGYVVDGTNSKAPGGSYPAAALSCIGCHDPHGKYRRDNTGTISTTGKPIYASGSYYNASKGVSVNEPTSWGAVGVYRLLGGIGYTPKSVGSNAFVNTVPVAKVNSTYQNSAGEATLQYRVAYGSSMSEWCANCHNGMLQNGYTSGMAGLTHPAGNNAKLTNVFANYNAYVKTGDMTGVQASSGNTLIPWETGSTDYAATALLAVNSATFGGPDAAGNVQCLTCHRAHASGWDSMLRFPYGNEFMTVADSSGNPLYPSPTTNPAQAMGRQIAEFQAGLYNRPVTQFAPYQRLLCNKCHAKD